MKRIQAKALVNTFESQNCHTSINLDQNKIDTKEYIKHELYRMVSRMLIDENLVEVKQNFIPSSIPYDEYSIDFYAIEYNDMRKILQLLYSININSSFEYVTKCLNKIKELLE